MEHVATIEVPINLTRVKSAEDYKIQLDFKSVAELRRLELLWYPVLDYCLLALHEWLGVLLSLVPSPQVAEWHLYHVCWQHEAGSPCCSGCHAV